MTTGDVPPNSDKGGSFGHDPKVCSIALLIVSLLCTFLLNRYQSQLCAMYTKCD